MGGVRNSELVGDLLGDRSGGAQIVENVLAGRLRFAECGGIQQRVGVDGGDVGVCQHAVGPRRHTPPPLVHHQRCVGDRRGVGGDGLYRNADRPNRCE